MYESNLANGETPAVDASAALHESIHCCQIKNSNIGINIETDLPG